jgi:lipoyl(octanoyl) transferase
VIRRLGPSDYEATWSAMQDFTSARDVGTPDEIWLTEHPPVYTFGLAGRREHLLRDNGIAALKVDRGGQVTYHGPGQLVLYTLFDLRRLRLGVRDMVRALEAAVINWLGSFAIAAYGKVAAPGVYVRRDDREAKIGALGLKVKHGCTYHGVAVNVAMNLAPFSDIDPCGYPGLAVTDLRSLGIERTVEAAGEELAPLVAREVVRDR